MTETTHDYEDKIVKLLHKAEARGTTPEEAEALTGAAERLMIKFGIDQAMLAAKRVASGGVAEKIVTEHVDFTGIYSKGMAYMAHYVTSALGNVRCYQTDLGKRVRYSVVGFESDVKQTMTLLQSLQLQSVVAMNAWWKRNRENYYTGMAGYKARREFIISFGSGAGERIRLARVTAEGDAAKSEPGTALVLVDRKKQVDTWVDDNLRLRTGTNRMQGGGIGARQAGHVAGRNANTGGSQLGGSRTALGR